MWTSADSYLESELSKRSKILNNLESVYDENKDNELIKMLIELLVDEQIRHNIAIDNANTIYNQCHTLQLKTDNYKRYIETNKSLLEKLDK